MSFSTTSFRNPNPALQASFLSIVDTGVGVEKLLPAKLAKLKSRQDALQTIFSARLDIFCPPDFGCLGREGSFSTPTGVSDNVGHVKRFSKRTAPCTHESARRLLQGAAQYCSETALSCL